MSKNNSSFEKRMVDLIEKELQNGESHDTIIDEWETFDEAERTTMSKKRLKFVKEYLSAKAIPPKIKKIEAVKNMKGKILKFTVNFTGNNLQLETIFYSDNINKKMKTLIVNELSKKIQENIDDK